jgi:hypothetical protein
MSGVAAVRSLRPLSAVVVPEWLAEIVRPRRAPVPWLEMARAALAICVPLSVAFAAGRGSLGVLPATGGLLGTLADAGDPCLSRVKRVCSAAVFGGAAGLTIAVGRPAVVRRAAGGERGGSDGFGAGEGTGTAGRRNAQAGHRRGPGAARGARHRRAAYLLGRVGCGPLAGLAVVGLAGFEPATSAIQNCYECPFRVLALY